MVIHGGSVVDTTLTEIVKGERGAAGELIGQVEMQEAAAIEKNTETGIMARRRQAFLQVKAILLPQRQR